MAYIDEYGVEYTDDKKCVFRAPNNLSGKYQILEGVKEIYSNAFSYCENLKEIYIPNTVMSIGENAFESCSSLTEIQLPRYLETIDNNTFSNCVSLNKIIFGEELKIIGIEAFSNCTALLTVDFPSSLMVILSKAFVNCTSLKEIFIPRNLKDVDSSAFEGCANLDFLDVDNNNPFLCSFSSCIFTKNLNCLLLAPPKLNELTIPAETVKVDPLAFLTTTICPIKVNYLSINCEKIDWAYLRTSVEQVVIGKEVSYLPSLQFAHFENLSQVICESQSLAYVGYNVFHLTPWFEQSGVWENGVLYLGNCILKAQSDFYGKCTLIDGISVVAAEAFANCKNISSVKFNSSLTSFTTI